MSRDLNVDLVRPLARRTSLVATLAAVILTLGIPISLYSITRQSREQKANSYALRMAELVRDVVISQPELWYYDTPKLANHLHLLVDDPDVLQVAVIDHRGRRVDVPEEIPDRSALLIWWAHAPVYRGEQEVARVWVGVDAWMGITRVLLVLLLAWALGAFLSTLLYVVPVYVIHKAEIRIVSLLKKLENARSELAVFNEVLEDRVKERSHQLAETAEALRKSELQLREVAGRAVEATEQERQRVARELHDGAGQLLTAIRLNLQVLNTQLGGDNACFDQLVSVEKAVDDTIDELRTIAMDLHPAALDRLGLKQSLTEMCSSFAIRSELEIIFSCDDLPEKLPAAVESSCYRLVQECLTNAVKYAEADRIEVSVRYTKDGQKTLVVRVHDNGKGFDTEKQYSGLGLRGMNDRAALLGGAISIESQTNEGTTITATLPLSSGPFEEDGASE